MLPFNQDINLTRDDIRGLSSATGIIQFFDRLGYTIDRKKYEVKTLLSLKSALLDHMFKEQYIERIVRQDNGRFEVYLLESSHAKRKDLLEKFIDKFRYTDNCDYLFVLARKNAQGAYQLVNFLLVERNIPRHVLKEQTYKQWSLPHISMALNACYWSLEVKPDKPDESMRRLLCGFTYTEADVERQHGKLLDLFMKAHKNTLKEISKQEIPIFNNQGLFSSSYVLRNFSNRELSKDNIEEFRDCQAAYTVIRRRYQYAQIENNNLTIDETFSQLLELVLQTLNFRAQVPPGEEAPACYKLYHNYSIAHRQRKSSPGRAATSQQFAEGVQIDTNREARHQALVAPRLPGMDEIDQSEKPLTYCLVYPWGSKMDDLDRQSESSMSDPTTLVARLLNRQEVSWIIVTNGKLWRLYTSKAQHRARNYYEVNLADITELPRLQGKEVFQYFWFFFHAAAFTVSTPDLVELAAHDGGFQQSSFLDTFLKDSQQHAQAVETRLKERVFVKIFLHFAEGFVVYAHRNNLLKQDLEELSLEERNLLLTSFFRGTLTFLYRLLFVFYAEACNLLPVSSEAEYYPYSLTSMKVRIAMLLGWLETSRDYRCRRIYSDDKTLLYDELQKLFQIVDKGKPTFNIPQYNGGLFRTEFKSGDEAIEVEAATFLATYKIPDVYLALGLDNMARDLDKELSNERFNQAIKRDKVTKADGKSALLFIDYSELGVCQLGSIYEGLLEFKLDLPDKKSSGNNQVDELFPLLERTQQSTQKRKSQKHAAKAKLICSSDNIICLKQDQCARKASGSYYTPEYIVQHIVDETIGPSLEEHFQSVSRELLMIDRQYQQQQTIPGIAQEIYENHQSTVEQFFNFRVLDLAAGSGHFLVAAIDYIARKMMDQINYFKSTGRWHIILHEIQNMRKRVIQEMEEQKIRIDFGKLNDLTLLKRYVLKNCIYGVDINSMAVELTKVSLWLHCFTPGAPLVYLDHHIKQGNSLIGVALDEVRRAIEAEQHLLFSENNTWARIESSTKALIEANKLSDLTPQQTQASKNAYEMSARAVAPFKEVLNVYTSLWFSNHFVSSKKRQTPVAKVLDFLHSKKAGTRVEMGETVQITDIQFYAEKDAEQHSFFHWELEFPDVFVDLKFGSLTKNAGFDVIIGNPPYISANELNKSFSSSEKYFWKSYFKSASGAYDIYILFIEQAIRLNRQGGLSALITPNKFLSAPYAEAFREYFYHSARMIQLLNLSRRHVFDDPSVYPIVTVVQKAHSEDKYDITIKTITDNPDLVPTALTTQGSENLDKLPEQIWGFLISDFLPLLLKAQRVSVQVQNCAQVHASSTASEAGAYETALTNKKVENGKRFINTGLIDRYGTLWGMTPLTHKGLSFSTPYLDVSNSVVTKERKTQYGKPKIIFAKMAQRVEAFLDEHGEFASANTNFVYDAEYDLCYLLAVLNSNLMSVIYNGYFSALIMNGGYYQFQAPQLRVLPIRCITFSTPTVERGRHVAEAIAYYQQYLQADNNQCKHIMHDILNLVSHYLAQQQEASDIVHDLLAFLSGEMLRLNKEKQRLQQEFLDYLVSILKIQIQPDKKSGKTGLDALGKGKAALLNYPGDYQKGEKALDFTHLSNILRDNQRHIIKQIENDSIYLREVEDVYRDNVQKIETIKARLMMTDELIDEIVYRLYGLTQEEILIVKTSKQ